MCNDVITEFCWLVVVDLKYSLETMSLMNEGGAYDVEKSNLKICHYNRLHQIQLRERKGKTSLTTSVLFKRMNSGPGVDSAAAERPCEATAASMPSSSCIEILADIGTKIRQHSTGNLGMRPCLINRDTKICWS